MPERRRLARRLDRKPYPEWSGGEVGFAPQLGGIMGQALTLGQGSVFGKA